MNGDSLFIVRFLRYLLLYITDCYCILDYCIGNVRKQDYPSTSCCISKKMLIVVSYEHFFLFIIFLFSNFFLEFVLDEI